MRVQLVFALVLSAGLSVANAQAPAAESEPKAAAPAGEAQLTAPAGQASQAAQPAVEAPKATQAQASATTPNKPATPASDAKATAPTTQAKAATPVATPAGKKGALPKVDPEVEHQANVQFATARVYLTQEDLPAAAIDPLTNFLAVFPDHFQARLMRAYALGRVGRYREAQADYLQALEVMTGTSAEEVLARAQEFSFQRQREIALTIIEDGIRRLGPLPNLESAALKLEIALRRTDDAIARIQRMLARAKRKETLYAKLGDIFEEAGHPDKAMDARRQAVAAIDALPESEQQAIKMKRLRDDLVYRINRAKRSGW